MQNQEEARELRRQVARLKRGRPGYRFSTALRQRITAWVIAQRERGEWWTDLANEIDVDVQTLKRWAAPPRSTSHVMREVEVIEPPVGDQDGDAGVAYGAADRRRHRRRRDRVARGLA